MLVATAAAVAGGCRNRAAVTERPLITVSIEPQRWLLERLVGNRMEVRSLLARGGNPESYEPTFSHLAALERSRAYLTVGNLGFEDAILEKVRANNPDLRIVCTSDSIELLHATHGDHDHGADPHVWSSAKNFRIMAENMLRSLREIDPEHAQEYNSNFIALAGLIDSVDARCDSLLAPLRGHAFMVWHPSLSYFARDYGLEQISLGAEGKEHSVDDTRALLNRMKSLDAEVFLVQKDFDSSRASSLAEGVRTVVIDPLNYDWDTEMLHTARAIAGRD